MFIDARLKEAWMHVVYVNAMPAADTATRGLSLKVVLCQYGRKVFCRGEDAGSQERGAHSRGAFSCGPSSTGNVCNTQHVSSMGVPRRPDSSRRRHVFYAKASFGTVVYGGKKRKKKKRVQRVETNF